MKFSYDWPVERQKVWCNKNFLKYLKKYVFPYHPYYRKKYSELGIKPGDIRTIEDIRKLPLTMKTNMKEDIISFILQPKFPGITPLYDTEPIRKTDLIKYIYQGARLPVRPASRGKHRTLKFRIEQAARREWFPIHFHASGGTTGDPSPALYTWYDIFRVTPQIAVMSQLCGIELDYKCLNLFPAAPHLAFFQVVISQFLFGGNVFHTCGGHVIPTERQILLAEQGKFDYVCGIPSYVTYWLDLAKKMQDEGKIGKIDNFKYAVVAGEPMVPAYSARLKQQLAAIGSPDCKIIEGYGMTEVKGAFYGCAEGSGIHLNAECYHWEVLDPETKEPVPEGEPGILTFSHVGFRGTVLIRYFTGDLINGIVWDKCPHCGLVGPRMKVPICRAVKDFAKIKGARVSLLTLQTAVRSTPDVETFRIVITKEKPEDPFSRDWVRIYVAAKEGADTAEIEHNLKKNIKLDCEISPSEVIFEPPEKIENKLFERTGLKADWIIDERQMPGSPQQVAVPHTPANIGSTSERSDS